MRRRVFVALILVVAFMPVAPCFCGDGSGGREDKVIRGEISSLDWVASTLTVKWYDPQDGSFEEATLTVPQGLKIVKSGNAVGLADMQIADQVIVRYYDDYDGTPEVISIVSPSP